MQLLHFFASFRVFPSRAGLGGRELDLFLHRAGFEVVPVDAEQVELAP